MRRRFFVQPHRETLEAGTFDGGQHPAKLRRFAVVPEVETDSQQLADRGMPDVFNPHFLPHYLNRMGVGKEGLQ